MRIGAHVSTAGGIDKAIDRALEIGAEAAQIFGSPPQQWATKPHSKELTEAYKRKANEAGVEPTFLHGIYLVNLATQNPENLKKGIAALVFSMQVCHEIDARGVIFHLGSTKGLTLDDVLDQIVGAIGEVLAKSPPGVWLCLENSAGMGDSIGSRFEELGRIINEVGSDQVKVCLDTCHAFAAGWDITTPPGIDEMFAEFDRHIGLANLVAVHANDSKVPLGAGIDRHENIGEGYIGLRGFETILKHPGFRELPFYLEVPGFDNTGPDQKNVEILKSLRHS